MSNQILDEDIGHSQPSKKSAKSPKVSLLGASIIYMLWVYAIALLCIVVIPPFCGAYIAFLLHVMTLFVGVYFTHYLLAKANWKQLIQNLGMYAATSFHSVNIVPAAQSDFVPIMVVALVGFYSLMGVLEVIVFVREDWPK